MAKVFIMTGDRAGKSVQLMGRYNFIDGIHLEEDDDTAKLKSAVLCKFYPCTMMDHADYVKQKDAESKRAKEAVAPVRTASVEISETAPATVKVEVAPSRPAGSPTPASAAQTARALLNKDA